MSEFGFAEAERKAKERLQKKVERLEAENERLRAAATGLTTAVGDYMQYQQQDDFERMEGALMKAIAALALEQK